MLKKWLWCECGKAWQDVAPLVLRLGVGAVFMMHGYGKLQNIDGTAGFFSSLGIPDAGFFAVLVACIEFFGGIALILGFMTHWAAKLTATVALFAYLLVHMEQEWSKQEFVITLFVGTVALMIMGAGKWSVDGWMEEKGWKPHRM